MSAAPAIAIAGITWRSSSREHRSAHAVDGSRAARAVPSVIESFAGAVALCGEALDADHRPAGNRRRCVRCVRLIDRPRSTAEIASVERRTRERTIERESSVSTLGAGWMVESRRDQIVDRARVHGADVAAEVDSLLTSARINALAEARDELRAMVAALPDEHGLDYVTVTALRAARSALEAAQVRIARRERRPRR